THDAIGHGEFPPLLGIPPQMDLSIPSSRYRRLWVSIAPMSPRLVRTLLRGAFLTAVFASPLVACGSSDGPSSPTPGDTSGSGTSSGSSSGGKASSGSGGGVSGSGSGGAHADAGSPEGWLHTSGNQILTSDGQPWVGRGVNVDDIFFCGYNNTLYMKNADQ